MLTLTSLVQTLQDEGFASSKKHVLHHAIRMGHISRPKKLTPRLFIFSQKNVDEFREYLLRKPKPGPVSQSSS